MSIPSGDADTYDASPTLNHPDILCFSHLRWHFVTQRPQHLLTLASLDHRIFYWEEPVWHQPGDLALQPDGKLGLHLEVLEEARNLWVLRPHLTWGIDFEAGQRELLDELTQIFSLRSVVAWFYTPMAINVASAVHPLATVYDCMDELSAFLNPPAGLVENERTLLNQADVVFTGGISLYEAKATQHANVHAFPSSIDVEHFTRAAGKLQDPADQANIPHPRAGFYGVIDERFDVALLAQVAALRPSVNFIILGPVVKIDPATLPQAANIHYLPGKTYNELPAYLSNWDIAVMPFALNAATRFISPTKTPEFLAAGRPVVSTPIRDVVRGYGESNLVAIADTPEAFASAIDSALQPQSEAWHKAVKEKLAQSSWQRTWQSMWHEIQRVLPSTGGRPGGGSTIGTPRRDAASFTRPQSTRHKENYDFIIVGAGFAGSVLAERLATQSHRRVLVIDKRDHIAGNAFDHVNSDGILVHRYGPHIFHTNSIDVVAYLSRFTEWRPYEHRVLSSVEGKLYPMPINLDTINQMYNLTLDADGMREFLAARTITPSAIRTSEDIVVSRVGRELYERFFRNYTRKQWGLDPSQLDASVAGRIPVRFDHDDRYFTDSFQAMPLHGYTAMFQRILDHPNITVRTGVDYLAIQRTYPSAQVIYTGPIDEYFGFRHGPLPYLSLDFRHETHNREVFQAAPVVNYPNDHDYTRVTEFKYLTGQHHPRTSIVYEYPRSTGDPYYPIPRPENAALFARYRALADSTPDVHFCGRLGSYRYLNMDQVVAQALATYKRSFAHEGLEVDSPPVPLTTPWVPVAAD